jgi:hypothetical protein
MNSIVETGSSETVGAVTRLSLARSAPSTPMPLTLQQEWAWKHYMQPAVPYIVYDAWRLRGPLDVNVLCRSLGTVIERHESLRTRIVISEGHPKQRVDEPDEFCLKVLNFDVEAEAKSFLQGFFWRQLDLERDSLFDVRLLRLGGQDHVLGLVLHHLFTDSVSFNLLLRELWTTYEALAQGKRLSLPPLPLQYCDYALWQRNERGHWSQVHHDYWSRKLASTAVVHLPKDDGLDHVSPHKRTLMQISLGEVLSDSLRTLARSQRATISHLILALYAVLLSQWSGLRDFVIAYVVSGRLGSMDRNVMGFIGQILVLKIELTGDETFPDVLNVVTREFFTAYEHLDFGKIIGDRPDLFTGIVLNGVVDSLDAFHKTELYCGGNNVALEPFPVPVMPPEESRQLCDMHFNLWNTTSGIWVRCDYRGDLFVPDTIRKFLADLQSFAQQVTQEPTTRVSSLRGSRRMEAHSPAADARAMVSNDG